MSRQRLALPYVFAAMPERVSPAWTVCVPPVAVGRDYADATPVRGVFKGDAKETMEVHVRVSEARS